jgi:anti-anti-sigma factor
MAQDISLTGCLDRYGSTTEQTLDVSQPRADRSVLSPSQPLVAGGAAEAFDRGVQELFRNGRRRLIVDLGGVSAIDSAGIRALVRGFTTAQRLGGRFRLAAPRPVVARALELSRLLSTFEIYDSVEAAWIAAWPWRAICLAMAGSALCGALVWAGLRWPLELAGISDGAELLGTGKNAVRVIPRQVQPFLELLKLVASALVGLLVTAVHQPASRDGRASMKQAQTLLSVSGAVMMIIIGNSLARAFGIAGAASIIRFRTPVDDPKDVTVLFLLMGLGMSIGLGAFAVAGLGTAFLCIALIALDRMSTERPRAMWVEIRANGPQFPTTHVESVFARHHIAWEPREISITDEATAKYHTWLDQRTSLENLNDELMAQNGGVKAVSWDHAKRERV